MHMRDQRQRRFKVDLSRVERYRFAWQASEDGRLHGGLMFSDEHDPVGDASAPATPALLAAAVGHCLSASLLEALRHAHVDVVGCETEAVSTVAPNADGLPRIDHLAVVIRPLLATASNRTKRCEEVFERHCTVTSSVRQGIDVRVQVEWRVAPAAVAVADASGSE